MSKKVEAKICAGVVSDERSVVKEVRGLRGWL